MLSTGTSFLITAKRVTGKSQTKLSDFQTFIKSRSENLPKEQFMLEQTKSEEALKIIKKHMYRLLN